MATDPSDIKPAEPKPDEGKRKQTFVRKLIHLVKEHLGESVAFPAALIGIFLLDAVWKDGLEMGMLLVFLAAIGLAVSHVIQTSKEKQAETMSKGTKDEIEGIKKEFTSFREEVTTGFAELRDILSGKNGNGKAADTSADKPADADASS